MLQSATGQVVTETLETGSSDVTRALSGAGGSYLRQLAADLDVTLGVRGHSVFVQGSEHEVKEAIAVLKQLVKLLTGQPSLPVAAIRRYTKALRAHPEVDVLDALKTPVLSTGRRPLTPKTLNQRLYVEAIEANDLVFSIGPAGTGKTYLAMAMAVRALLDKQVKRIILTRPAVEAGEKLGFLPGDLAEKVNPYLRPLYDALHDMIDAERAQNLLQRGAIEVAPLAFMRGRTLNRAFVILDEAQNTTQSQMKMFLTRLGFDSKAVVTGDTTQVDLPAGERSGLIDAVERLSPIDGVRILRFGRDDVVRHALVQRIIEAYEPS